MSLPQPFIDEINSYGADCLEGLAEALTTTAPEVSVRVNRAKGIKVPDGSEIVPWCPDGFYLQGRPVFTFDPALHQGLYYVQDASSMAIVTAVKAIANLEDGKPMIFLDSCAAPGGKTTAALSALPAGSIAVANEYDFRRAAILSENIAKWGNPGVMVTRGDTSRFKNLKNAFDIIAADVPCSGEGMMRKDSEAVAQWSAALVKECAARQREIVDNLWYALRPGGYMIYSTCTFNRKENEDMVDYICRELGGTTINTGLAGHHGISPGISTEHDCCRFIPGKTKGEGLFMCVIRKDGNATTIQPRPSKKTPGRFTKAPKEATVLLDKLNGDFNVYIDGDTLYAIPAHAAKWMLDAATWLDVISIGIQTATIKGRDVIPSQSLALSCALASGAFPSTEIDYQQAIAYLRRETISVDAPRGYVMLTYQDRPLGFVKNLGNRANNLYPAQWRILSQNTPETYPIIIK